MQDIEQFLRVAEQRDFARDYMLRVRSIGDINFGLNEDDFIYFKTLSLPTKDITNQKADYMGLAVNFPGTVKYPGSDSWTVKVHADQRGIIRRKFEEWQKSIFDDATSVGDLGVRGLGNVIQLDLVDDQLQVLNTYKLFGVFVRTLGAQNYDMQGDGKPLDYDVTLSYIFWRHTLVADDGDVTNTGQGVSF